MGIPGEIPFVSFKKIPRLFRDVIITEKIDGTNGCVHVTEDMRVIAGSRNRWIYPEKGKDNRGFAAWVHENTEELLKLGPGTHYGEWWGKGIQRGYGLDEKRFSLFNTERWSIDRPSVCGVVPVLYSGRLCTITVSECADRLEEFGSVAAPGFMQPEGLVVFHPAAGQFFKYTLNGDGHKELANVASTVVPGSETHVR